MKVFVLMAKIIKEVKNDFKGYLFKYMFFILKVLKKND